MIKIFSPFGHLMVVLWDHNLPDQTRLEMVVNQVGKSVMVFVTTLKFMYAVIAMMVRKHDIIYM